MAKHKAKRVLFVTSANLASNPRCLKEVRTLVQEGYKVTVLKFLFDNWTVQPEAMLEKELKGVHWIKVSATRKPFIGWMASTAAEKIAKPLLRVFKDSTKLLSYAINKRSYLIAGELNNVKPAYDLVIAHNPAAFWPAYDYAKKHKLAWGADIEDYHPGETDNAQEQQNMIMLMQETLADADYVTAASPLILEKVTAHVPEIKNKSVVVNNVFAAAAQPAFNELLIENGAAIKLFWFSQHLGMHRGIPDAIAAMNAIDKFPVELTLLGNCTITLKREIETLLKNKKHKLIFKAPRDEQALMQEAAHHHIGLALEPGFNENNNVALSNKIFTYLLAGNAVIASDTDAQKLFLEQHPEMGFLYAKGDGVQFAGIIESLYENNGLLQTIRGANYMIATDRYNWEQEQEQFLKMVTSALK